MNAKQTSASTVLKRVFLCMSLAFLVMAFIVPDRGQVFSGLYKILMAPDQLTQDYFLVGSVSAAFFNTGVVGLICWLMMQLPGYQANGTTAIGYLLTVGFSFFGINVLNIWPCFLGAFVYAAVHKQKPSAAVNFAMFATALAPLVSDLALRYPGLTNHGFTPSSVALSILVGGIIGFLTAIGCAHSPNVHKGYSIYSAGLPMGMLGFLLRALLYNTLGGELPEISANLSEGFPLLCNAFCIVVFGACVVAGFVLNGNSFRGYGKLLQDTGHKVDFSAKYGPAMTVMNLGIYGLFIMLYYNLVGATWTGPTIGVVFCMLACGVSGSHPGNVWPIMVGYFLMSLVGQTSINAQAIVVGLCFANGLSPIAGQFGWIAGIVAGALHYSLVTSVPALHGGFCLYNGGFTACFIALIIVPILEKYLKTKDERIARKAARQHS